MALAVQSYRHQTRPMARTKTGNLLNSRFIGFMLLAVLALLYIAQSSASSTKTVEVQSLKSQADSVQTQVDQLQLEQERAKTLDMIAPEASPMGLQPVDSVEYLNKQP